MSTYADMVTPMVDTTVTLIESAQHVAVKAAATFRGTVTDRLPEPPAALASRLDFADVDQRHLRCGGAPAPRPARRLPGCRPGRLARQARARRSGGEGGLTPQSGEANGAGAANLQVRFAAPSPLRRAEAAASGERPGRPPFTTARLSASPGLLADQVREQLPEPGRHPQYRRQPVGGNRRPRRVSCRPLLGAGMGCRATIGEWITRGHRTLPTDVGAGLERARSRSGAEPLRGRRRLLSPGRTRQPGGA